MIVVFWFRLLFLCDLLCFSANKDQALDVLQEKKNHMASVALFLVGKIYKEKLNDIISRNKICTHANLQLVFRIPFILFFITVLKMPKHDPGEGAVTAYSLGTDNSPSPCLPTCGRGTAF